MEKFEIYRLIHFTGIFTLLFAFGSLFTGEKTTKGAAIGHGIALFLIILGGFGMQVVTKEANSAIFGTTWPVWMILKGVIWLIFGASLVLAKRRVIKGAVAWIIIVGLALGSYWLAYNKPALGNKPKAVQSE